MKLYIDKREAFILETALGMLKFFYPNRYGTEAQALQDKLLLCIQLQKSGKGYHDEKN